MLSLMNWPLFFQLLITAAIAIGGWFAVHWLTKNRERESEWRKEKLAHYKEFFAALAGIIGTQATAESRKRYAIAFNTVGLFASQEVIQRLHSYQEISRLPFDQQPTGEHDSCLTQLVLSIRRDLRLKPKDEEKSFLFHMISASVDAANL